MKRRMCSRHYQRWRSHGDPHGGRRRYGTAEESLLHRTEWRDGCLVWTGTKNWKGYGQLGAAPHAGTYVHRYVWERENGPIPEGMMIDHVCWNRACVNLEHLRLATAAENASYKSRARSDSSTGIRNVRRTKSGKYQGLVTKDGRTHHAPPTWDPEEAREDARLLREKLFGTRAGEG